MSNHDSVYHFARGHWRGYIKRIADKSVLIPTAFSTFREIPCLPGKFRNMIVQELSESPQLMMELYYALKKGMAPESQYKLPYKKTERERELVENIAEIYSIDKDKAQSKIVVGHYINKETEQEFNYAIEIVIAPKTNVNVDKHAGQYDFIGNINSTPSIDGGSGYFSDGPFDYVDKDGESRHTTSIHSVLFHCGFVIGEYYGKIKRKVPSVVFINVKTPCPDWLGSAGKTEIDMKPYAGDIANTVYRLARKIPSYYPKSLNVRYDDDKSEVQRDAVDYLIDFLKERKADVEANPELRIRDRITQQGVWYRINPKMREDGFIPNKTWTITRKSITGDIQKVCREYLGVGREDLGIIAAARATMLYRGQSIPVSIDNLKSLVKYGAVIVVIEKEGVADVLEYYAKRYGIALVHTRGRLTAYGNDFIDEAKKIGAKICILVDCDVVGNRIYKSAGCPRIGITRDVVTWLQENGYPNVTEAELEEEYEVKLTSEDDSEEIDPHLLDHRIELDAIVAHKEIKAEGLWKYVKYKIESEIEPLDYTGEVDIPAYESLYSDEMTEIVTYLRDYTEGVVSDIEEDVTDNELSESEELIDVQEKEDELQKRFEEVVSEDEGIKAISKELGQLIKRLPKLTTTNNNSKKESKPTTSQATTTTKPKQQQQSKLKSDKN